MNLHSESEKIIKATFAMYKDGGPIGGSRKFQGRTILHLYPTRDTFNQDGELDGYYQNLFFNLDVYDAKKMVKYSAGEHDAIFTSGCNINNVTVFKDGAFCICIDGEVEFLSGQAVTFSPKP